MIATREGEQTGDAEWKLTIIVPLAAIFTRLGVKMAPSMQGNFDSAS